MNFSSSLTTFSTKARIDLEHSSLGLRAGIRTQILEKVQMGALKEGLEATLCKSSAIVHIVPFQALF